MDHLTTGPCCLVCRDPHTLAPGDIGNRLCQAMVLYHVGNLEGFKRQDAVGVHQASGGLMAKVIATIGNPLMDMGDNLATLGACWCPFVSFGQPPLGFRQGFFVGAKKVRVDNFLTAAQRREAHKSDIDAYGEGARLQRQRCRVHRETGIPFACRSTAQGQRFDGALDGTMQDQSQYANFGNVQQTVCEGKPRLLKREAVVASWPTETRKPWGV